MINTNETMGCVKSNERGPSELERLFSVLDNVLGHASHLSSELVSMKIKLLGDGVSTISESCDKKPHRPGRIGELFDIVEEINTRLNEISHSVDTLKTVA